MAGNLEINSNLDIYGSLKLSSVPNQIGTLLTFNETTREVGGRSYNDIINDLNLNGVYAKTDGSNVVVNSIWNIYSKGIYSSMPGQSASDYYRIIGLDEGSDMGALEIATSDNGDEPIYVRQYSYLGGTGSGVDLGFGSLIRSATLLGRDGNTSFPENVTAKRYSWSGFTSAPMGIVDSTSAFNNIGSSYGYGISTNQGGGLDIMANQSLQPIRFWAGGDNVTPRLSATFNGEVAKFTGQVHTTTDFILDSSDANYKGLNWKTDSVQRWFFYSEPNQEAGGNSGSDLLLARYADNGGYLGNIFRIFRNSGEVRFNDNLSTVSYGNAQLWYQAYLATQNLSNDYVSRLSVDQSVAGVKTFIGGYTQWLLNNDAINNGQGFIQSNFQGFLAGSLNDFDYILYRNSQQKVLIRNAYAEFVNQVKAPQFEASNGGLIIYGNGGVNANTTKIFFGNPAASIGWAISQGINNVTQEGLSFGTWDGSNYVNKLFLTPNSDLLVYGNITTNDYGSADLWMSAYNAIGFPLSNLATSDQSSLIAAINEIKNIGTGNVRQVNLLGLDENTWYPVVSTGGLSVVRAENIHVFRTLDGSWGVPSYSTHGGGFSVDFYIETIGSGWGVTGSKTRLIRNNFSWINSLLQNNLPVGFQQLTNSSLAVMWLRGGSIYAIETSWRTEWTIHTALYTTPNGESVQPSPSCVLVFPENIVQHGILSNYISTYDYGNAQNWWQAYQWGNHATFGYATEAWVKSWGLGNLYPDPYINIDDNRGSGFYNIYGGFTSGATPYGYASLIHVNFNTSEFGQLAIQQGSESISYRIKDGGGTIRNWVKLWDNLNFNPQNYVNRSGDSMSGKITYGSGGLDNAGFMSDVSSNTGVGGYARNFATVIGANASMNFGFFGGGGNIYYTYLGEGADGWNNPTIRFNSNRVNIGHYGNTAFHTDAILTVGTAESRSYSPTFGHMQNSAHFSMKGDNGLFGTAMGVDSASGATWIQGLRYDSNTSYDINLNPLGSTVSIWKDNLNPNGNALTTNGRIVAFGNESNYVMTWQSVTGVDQIVAGHEFRFYDNYWKVGNKRGGSANSLGFSFEFNGVEKALIDADGFITVRGIHSPAFLNNFGNSQVINAGGTTLYIGNPSLTDIVIEGVGYGSLHYYSLATGKHKIFHAANLQFGSGLSYDGTTLSASGGGGVPDYLYGWADTRSTDTVPDDYNGVFRAYGIKGAGLYGLSGGYVSVFGYRGWSDSSGGRAIEFIICDDDNVYYRKGDTTDWDAMFKFYTDSNLQFGSGLNYNNGIVTLASAPTRIKGGSGGFYIGGDVSLEAGTAMAIQQSGQSIILHSSDTTYSAGNGLFLSGTQFAQSITTSGGGNAVVGISQTSNGFQVNYGSIVASIPVATTTVLGGVKDGNGVNIAADGTLSMNVGSSGSGTFVTSISQTTTGITYTMGTMSVGVTAVALNLGNAEGLINTGSSTITSSGTFALGFDTGYSLVKPADRTLLDKLTRQATTQNYTSSSTSAQTLNASVGNHRIYRSLSGCQGMLLHFTPQDGDRITIHGYQFGGLQIRNGVGWGFQNIYGWESASPVTNFIMIMSCLANPNTTCTLVYRGSLSAWVVEAMHY